MAVINIDDAYILGETGAQVDKVTGLFTKDEDTTSGEKAFAQLNIGTAGSNRNLLDNPWFTVNQRGLTSYSAGYSVDRWVVTSNASINVLSDGIELTTTANRWGMEQRRVKNLIPHGTTVTFSALIDDGEIAQKSFVWNGASTTVYPDGSAVGLEINTAPTTYDRWYVCNTIASTHTIHAVKIEVGSVSTLANDVPPDYGTELIKCRGYFERIHSLGSSEIVGMGMGVSASSVRIGIPSLICHTIKSVTYSGGGLLLEGGGNYRTLTSIGKLNATPKNGFLTVTCGSSDAITLYQTYALVGTAAGGYIDISADL